MHILIAFACLILIATALWGKHRGARECQDCPHRAEEHTAGSNGHCTHAGCCCQVSRLESADTVSLSATPPAGARPGMVGQNSDRCPAK